MSIISVIFRELYKKIKYNFFNGVLNADFMAYENILKKEEETSNPKVLNFFSRVKKDEFNYDGNLNRNGDAFNLTKPYTNYKRLPLSINSSDVKDLLDLKNKNFEALNSISLEKRNSIFRKAIELYVNGLRVSCKDTFVTIYNGDIDILVEKKYFNRENNDVIFVISENSNESFKFTFEVTSKTNFTVTQLYLSQNKSLIEDTDVNKYALYRNGKLLLKNEYELIIENDKFKFKPLYSLYKKDELIEVCYDKNTVYKEEYIANDKYLLVPKNIFPNYPIDKNNLEIYIDGRRYSNNNASVVNPRCFKLFNFKSEGKGRTITYFVKINPDIFNSLEGYHDDATKFMHYIGYKSKDEIEKLIEHKDTPDFVTNRENKFYPKERINLYNGKNEEDYPLFLHNSILKYIDRNSTSLKYFFGKLNDRVCIEFDYIFNDDNQTVLDTSKEIGDYQLVNFSSPKIPIIFDIENYENYEILLYIDDIKIAKSKCSHYKIFNTNYIYLDKNYFKKDKPNRIRIECYRIYNKKLFKEFYPINNEDLREKIIINKNSLGIVRYLIDIDVLLESKNKDGYHYLKNNIDYNIIEKNDTYEVSFINKLNIDDLILVQNSSNTYHLEYNFPNEKNFDIKVEKKFTLDTLDKVLNKIIPRSNNYNMMVFLDGILLMDQTDYIYSNFYKHKVLTKNKIIFKYLPKPNSHLEIYFLENERKRITSFSTFFSDYGAFYINGTKAPYDERYIDIYLNYKKLREDDIEIISDRIIKIRNIPKITSLSNLAVYTNFLVHRDELKEYENFYDDNYSLWEEYILKDYRITDGIDPTDELDKVVEITKNKEKDETIDDFYKKWGEDPPFDKKVKDDEGLIHDDERVNPISDHIVDLIKKYKFKRLIDCNEYRMDLLDYTFIELMDNPKDTIIALDANSRYIGSTNGVLDCNSTRFANHVKNHLVKEFLNKYNNLITADNLSKFAYEKERISKFLYFDEYGKFIFEKPDLEPDWKIKKKKNLVRLLDANTKYE